MRGKPFPLTKLAVVIALPVVFACTAGSYAQTAAVPSQNSPRLYVANQEAATVSIIDIGSNDVIETIELTELGFTPNAKPHHTAVEPDGSFWYVSLIADGRVLKFDRSNQLVGQAEFETPGMLALDVVEDRLYVGRSMAAVNPPQRIGVINRSDMSISEIDVFFPRPHAIVVDASGEQVYSGSLAVNQLASIDSETEVAELTNLEGPSHVLVQFALSPDGTRLVATAQLTAKLLVFDLADPKSPKLLRAVDVNAQPWHPAFSPDGKFVYFGNLGANSVTVVDANTWSVVDVIAGDGLAEPHGVAFSPDGRSAYVSNRNTDGSYAEAQGGTVVVIDTATRTIVKVIPVGRYAAGISTRR